MHANDVKVGMFVVSKLPHDPAMGIRIYVLHITSGVGGVIEQWYIDAVRDAFINP